MIRIGVVINTVQWKWDLDDCSARNVFGLFFCPLSLLN